MVERFLWYYQPIRFIFRKIWIILMIWPWRKGQRSNTMFKLESSNIISTYVSYTLPSLWSIVKEIWIILMIWPWRKGQWLDVMFKLESSYMTSSICVICFKPLRYIFEKISTILMILSGRKAQMGWLYIYDEFIFKNMCGL